MALLWMGTFLTEVRSLQHATTRRISYTNLRRCRTKDHSSQISGTALVNVFSGCDFTNRKDIFPAIAGVARRVHEFTKHRYLAGLWEEVLCCGLLWTPDTTIVFEPWRRPASLRQLLQTLKNSTRSIAPSWSWASRRSRANFLITNQVNTTCRMRLHLRAEFDILECRFLVDGVNPFGRIDAASISLFGSAISVDPSSLASMQWAFHVNSNQLFELYPGLFTLIKPDLKARNPHKATGTKKQMRQHFQLLLIASCCPDCT
jgi:hypothetical protein